MNKKKIQKNPNVDLPVRYLAVAVYTHYFSPGSLRISSDAHITSLEEFEDIFGENTYPQFANTRKWLQKSETPYPGYCRAPASAKCLPKLCNCDKLTLIWNQIKEKKMLSEKLKKLNSIQ